MQHQTQADGVGGIELGAFVFTTAQGAGAFTGPVVQLDPRREPIADAAGRNKGFDALGQPGKQGVFALRRMEGGTQLG
jgi:hypothetical protein